VEYRPPHRVARIKTRAPDLFIAVKAEGLRYL
jgi:hypothetical protein